MRRRVLAAALLLLPITGSDLPAFRGLRRVAVQVGPSWSGVPAEARLGLKLLLEDLAETAGSTLVEVRPEEGPQPPDITVISLEGDLAGARLQLRGRLSKAGSEARDVAPPDPDPRDQLQALLAACGLRSPFCAEILPSDPARLLPLARIYGIALLGADEEVLALGTSAEDLAALEPRCAPAALARAEAINRRLFLRRPSTFEAKVICAQAFEEALEALTDFPRTARYAGWFYTESGDQRRALTLLFNAERRWPRSPGLRAGLAYAARTAGLLEGARAALEAESKLEGRSSAAFPETENTYLYSGAWDRFEAHLGPGSTDRPNAMADFYRGYLRLLMGRREEALLFFRRAAMPGGSGAEFQALATAYAHALDGHRPEALLTLRNLSQSRKDLRVPDGEFTFKLAEAYGFLDDPEDALDAAQLAFVQGFSCSDWYEQAPLLAGLHHLPRWRALMAHLREREQLLRADFPPGAFGA